MPAASSHARAGFIARGWCLLLHAPRTGDDLPGPAGSVAVPGRLLPVRCPLGTLLRPGGRRWGTRHRSSIPARGQLDHLPIDYELLSPGRRGHRRFIRQGARPRQRLRSSARRGDGRIVGRAISGPIPAVSHSRASRRQQHGHNRGRVIRVAVGPGVSLICGRIAARDEGKRGQDHPTSGRAPAPPRSHAGATEGLRETTSPGVGRRLLALRIPVWTALALLGLVGVLVGALLLSRDPVDLGPAVDGATEASISVTVCNETVDRRHINPRTAELDLEKGLEALGVQQAQATLTRIDCKPDDPQE